jgi:tetratricopeptide (TPR) repeat protein
MFSPIQLFGCTIGRAKARQLQGDTSRAIDDYCRALDINAGNAEAYCGRGAAYLEKGWYELAIDDLTMAKALAPNSHEALCRRAQACLAAGKPDDAIADARSAIQLAANDGPAYLALGSAILSSPKEKPDRAIEYLKYAMRIDNKLAPLADAKLAEANAKAGMPVEANNAFDVAKDLNPTAATFPPPPSPLEKALAHAKSLLVDGMNLLGRQQPLLAQDQFDDAVDAFTAILLTDPKNVEALRGRGSAYLKKKDWDAAVADLNQLIERNPRSAEAYCLRVEAYLNKGDYYMAKRDATQAIRLKPDYALAYFYRAAADCKTKDYEPALANLDEVAKLNRKPREADAELLRLSGDLFVEICRSQALEYSDAQQLDQAVDRLVAIDKNPNLFPTNTSPGEQARRWREKAKAYQDLGASQLGSHNWDEAIDSFGKAIAAKKEEKKIADKENKIADKDKMIPFDKANAERLNYQLAQAHQGQGSAFVFAKRWDDAIKSFGKVIEILENTVPSDKSSAERRNAQLVQASRELAQVYANRGFENANLGKFKEAVHDLKLAIDRDKDNPQTYRISSNS